MQNCIFLDRDGVINVDRGTYTWEADDFELVAGVPEALQMLKKAGFLLVIITNQAGIAKGLYTDQAVWDCHAILQQACGSIVDEIYFSPYHPDVTASIARKPGTLLFEKAIAKYCINPAGSWMVGDQERDLIPAKALGMRTVRISPTPVETIGDYMGTDLPDVVSRWILPMATITKN